MPSLDIFNNDAFGLVSMTKAINDQPFVPGRIGQLGYFNESPITTTTAMIEREGSTLSLVASGNRGGVAKNVAGANKRNMIPISTVHLPQTATILADEIQNVRAFGAETEVETVQNVVNKRLAKMRRNIDATGEYQRIGAIKGQVLDADGSTVLLDLFQAFGVTQQTFAMLLSTDATKVRNKVVAAKRLVENELGGLTYSGMRGFCSQTFFDALVAHPAVEAAYDRWLEGQWLREDVRLGFAYGGVIWEEYRGKVGTTSFIEDGSSYLVPEGVPDLFETNYAPADYMETANTLGLPLYAKQEALDMNKGIVIEAQSNPISICTRPRAVVKLTIS